MNFHEPDLGTWNCSSSYASLVVRMDTQRGLWSHLGRSSAPRVYVHYLLFETHRRCELEALPVEAERSMPRAARNDARPPERGDARPRERGRDQRVSLCADFCRSELILRFTHVSIASRPGAPLRGVGAGPGGGPGASGPASRRRPS